MHSRQGGLPSLESLAEVMQATRRLLTEQAGLSLNVHSSFSILLWVLQVTMYHIFVGYTSNNT